MFQVFPNCKAKKQTNSFVRFLGESTARQSAYGFIWPFQRISTYSHLSDKRGGTFIDFEKRFHPPRTFPPSTFIDFLDFFHPPLHVYCIYVIVFSKKSHPPRLFQPPRLLERSEYLLKQFLERLNKILALKNDLGYKSQFCNIWKPI